MSASTSPLQWHTAVLSHENRSARSFAAASALLSYLDRDGAALPKMQTMAERACMSVSTIQRGLAELEAAGFLSHKRSRYGNTYTIQMRHGVAAEHDEPETEFGQGDRSRQAEIRHRVASDETQFGQGDRTDASRSVRETGQIGQGDRYKRTTQELPIELPPSPPLCLTPWWSQSGTRWASIFRTCQAWPGCSRRSTLPVLSPARCSTVGRLKALEARSG